MHGVADVGEREAAPGMGGLVVGLGERPPLQSKVGAGTAEGVAVGAFAIDQPGIRPGDLVRS